MPTIQPNLFMNLVNLSSTLCIVSVLIIIIIYLIGISNEGAVIGLITSYSAILCAIVFLSGLIYINMSPNFPSYATIVFTLFPFILLMSIPLFILSLLTMCFDTITLDHMPSYYNSLSFGSALLLAAALSLLLSAVLDKGMDKTFVMKPTTYSWIVFLGTVNIIVVAILAIIVKFYAVTDG